MTSSTIRFYRGANAPPAPIAFDVDLTGSTIELEIVPVHGAAPIVFSSAGESPELALDPPSRVLLSYTDAFVAALPAGMVALWQAFQISGEGRRRIGAGKVWVGADGDWMEGAGASVEVPGVQGPPGAAGEPLILVVSDTLDIGLGGWWVTRDYHGPATFDYLRAEMLMGVAAGVTLSVRKNGSLVRGPLPIGDTPTLVTDLGLVLAAGDQVSVHREGGMMTAPWLMLVQIDGRI